MWKKHRRFGTKNNAVVGISDGGTVVSGKKDLIAGRFRYLAKGDDSCACALGIFPKNPIQVLIEQNQCMSRTQTQAAVSARRALPVLMAASQGVIEGQTS